MNLLDNLKPSKWKFCQVSNLPFSFMTRFSQIHYSMSQYFIMSHKLSPQRNFFYCILSLMFSQIFILPSSFLNRLLNNNFPCLTNGGLFNTKTISNFLNHFFLPILTLWMLNVCGCTEAGTKKKCWSLDWCLFH